MGSAYFDELMTAANNLRAGENVDQCPYCLQWLKFDAQNTCKLFCLNCKKRWDCGDNTQLML
jgi:hypothetical protein